MTARWCRSLVAMMLLALGCGDGELIFEGVTWESGRVRYHSRHFDPLACPEVLPALERNGELFAGLLESADRPWEPFDYYKAFDRADYETFTPCDGRTLGCARPRAVFSPRPVDEHELAHVYYVGTMGAGPPFLEEGFAVGLTCEVSAGLGVAADAPLEAALGPEFPDGLGAPARLVTALWSAGTPAQFAELERELGERTPSADDLAARVRRIYDVDLDELWSAARSRDGIECIAAQACSAPPLEFGPVVLRETCAGQEARVLSDALGPALGIRSAGVPLALRACSAEAEPSPLRRVTIGIGEAPWRNETWLKAPAEPLALLPSPRLLVAEFLGQDSVLEVRDLGAAFSTSCTTEGTSVLPELSVQIVVPYEPASYHFPLAFSERLSASLSWLSEVAAPPVVRWCSGCPGDAGVICSALDAMPTELVAEGTAVLIVDVEQSPTAPLRLDVSFALPDVGTP